MIEAMIASALDRPQPPSTTACGHDQIILSAKVSGVRDLLDVYTKLSPRAATIRFTSASLKPAWARRA